MPSLVGSEMCIRDSVLRDPTRHRLELALLPGVARRPEIVAGHARPRALFRLFDHRVHTAMARPPLVGAQLTLFVVCAVVGGDDGPRAHSALGAVLVLAPVILLAICPPEKLPVRFALPLGR